MSVEIIETATHVFQVELTPDTPGYIRRVLTISLLSGPDLTDAQWGRVKEVIVRALIASGNRVHRVGAVHEPPEDDVT